MDLPVEGWKARYRAAREQFRLLVESNADGIVVVDLVGRITYVNRAAEDLFGREAQSMIGGHFGYPVVADETIEIDVLCDSRPIVAEMRVKAIEWDGEAMLLASLRDVTGRKRLQAEREDRLREQVGRIEAELAARRLGFLYECGELLSATLDPAVQIERFLDHVVPDFADWCAISVSAIGPSASGPRHRFAARHADANFQSEMRDLEEVYRDPLFPARTALIERRVIEETGETACTRSAELLERLGYVSAVHTPILGSEVAGCISFVLTYPRRSREALLGECFTASDRPLATDLARRLTVALDNSHLYQTAAEAARLRDSFLATVSHELRSPIQAIQSWVEVLSRKAQGRDDLLQGLSIIERNAEAQSHLVEDIVDVSRVLQGKLQLRRESIDLADLLADLGQSLAPRVEAKEQTLEIDVEPLPLLLADPNRLRQVLVNLFTNAIKFTPVGGRITSTARRDGDFVEITVEDSGVGIAPEMLGDVFQAFRRAREGETARAAGLGLGLAIVRNLVELHGGEVRAESRGLGHGSRFIVRLPSAELD